MVEQHQSAKTIIEPRKGSVSGKLRELWAYRELLFFLAWRDIKVKYKQTVLGIMWAIIQPLFAVIVFNFFLGQLGKMDSDGFPYPIFVLCALLPWQFFANTLAEASNSLVSNQNLITKVYFPRLVIPFAPIIAGLVDLGIAFLMLLGMMAYYGAVPLISAVFWIPLLITMTLFASLGVALWLSALNVQYRDIRYTIPFLTQIWFFATPIVYSANLMQEPWRTVFGVNPMSGIVQGFRWALLGNGPAPGSMLVVSAAAIVIIVYTGFRFFQRVERTFADIV